jgi:uncharacterized membrane protein
MRAEYEFSVSRAGVQIMRGGVPVADVVFRMNAIAEVKAIKQWVERLDPALGVCEDLVDTVNVTGGVVMIGPIPEPVGSRDWADLGLVYERACGVLGSPVKIEEDDMAGL